MRPKILAFYLPQYYPIPENDEWWGKGFTEWTNVGRAKPLYKGHYQPKVPSELGYYDLRLPIVREQQAALAKEYGVDGFCFWHYWFGNGKRLLDLVENEVVESGKPDFPFCFFWANHSWAAKNWNSKDSKFGQRVLVWQEYPGIDDYKAHFMSCFRAFKDPRYIKVDNKPLFGIYDVSAIPDFDLFKSCWDELARQNGLDGIYFVAYCRSTDNYQISKQLQVDEFIVDPMNLCDTKHTKFRGMIRNYLSVFMMDKLIKLHVVPYERYVDTTLSFYKKNPDASICILPNFDHSPRSGNIGLVLHQSTPSKFKKLLEKIKRILEDRQTNNNFLYIKAWNEWGEGNYLEPDLKFGRGYLESIVNTFGINR